eukprot:1162043-Pelagomonas_calceolata.AAC.8
MQRLLPDTYHRWQAGTGRHGRHLPQAPTTDGRQAHAGMAGTDGRHLPQAPTTDGRQAQAGMAGTDGRHLPQAPTTDDHNALTPRAMDIKAPLQLIKKENTQQH